MFNNLTCLQAAGRASRGEVPTENPSPALPLVGRMRRQLVSEVMEDGTEDLTAADPFVSPSTGMGTTVVASTPLAPPDLSLPAPSWFLTRSRGSVDPGPAGRRRPAGSVWLGLG